MSAACSHEKVQSTLAPSYCSTSRSLQQILDGPIVDSRRKIVKLPYLVMNEPALVEDLVVYDKTPNEANM